MTGSVVMPPEVDALRCFPFPPMAVVAMAAEVVDGASDELWLLDD